MDRMRRGWMGCLVSCRLERKRSAPHGFFGKPWHTVLMQLLCGVEVEGEGDFV
jgi:hypothetical protein